MERHAHDTHPALILPEETNDPQRGTTKRKRIFRTRWLFTSREEAGNRIQLVRQRYRHRHRRGGHVVALPDRLVVVADGVGDFAGFALGGGVIAAHQALKFGEFANHAGDEVRLCQFRRPPRQIGRVLLGDAINRRDNALFDQPAGEFGDAVDLVRDGAELFVEDDVRELCGLFLERGLQIGVVEEARVRQAGGEDLAVALDDLGATVDCFDVGAGSPRAGR
ncbi:hypothetical protein WR25_13109 [Diploscapter pachys]|uniref:Uncharacterized protein n=1 Tax=Diploscapter pachys TaxID=2018661 RepID=A0A2A2M382_9BILA|nr:hypothetical protein WR25_13109 [Diploscapter pachys]